MTYQQHSRRAEARAMRQRFKDRVIRHAWPRRYDDDPKWMKILLALSYGASVRMAFHIGRQI